MSRKAKGESWIDQINQEVKKAFAFFWVVYPFHT